VCIQLLNKIGKNYLILHFDFGTCFGRVNHCEKAWLCKILV
jgi:hypothetical protein